MVFLVIVSGGLDRPRVSSLYLAFAMIIGKTLVVLFDSKGTRYDKV